jgi:hypothetical protein
MHNEAFYQEPQELLSQGDILELTPHVILKENPLRVLRQQTGRGGRPIMIPYPYPPDPALPENGEGPSGGYRLDRPEGDLISAHGQVTFGLVLSHGCEIDKPNSKTRLMALIRLLSEGIPEQTKQNIRQNRVFSSFYLPAIGTMSESYADLSRISCPSPVFIDNATKIASLSEAAVGLLHYQLFRFLTRKEVDDQFLVTAQTRMQTD